jgi:(1->4)-alpha-D-glucan 1-alpha-D-glucosylmutase
MRLNRAHRAMVDGEPAPDRNDEYRFYQSLVGVWPLELPPDIVQAPDDLVDRMKAYMIKAVKEAKLHTSWVTPNQPYENAVVRFVERVLTGTGGARFLPAFLPFQRRIAVPGMVNSLAQTAIKICAPGVPDFYQGTDLWDLSLVDPDNRRPVDFELRQRLLSELEPVFSLAPEERTGRAASLLKAWPDGRIKLLVTAAGLRLRKELPDLFLSGDYVPIDTEVTVNAGVVAFARVHGTDVVLVVAPRLVTPLVEPVPIPLGGPAWKTSRIMLPETLAGRTFRHVITGAEIRPVTAGSQSWIFVGQLFETVPVAMLRA